MKSIKKYNKKNYVYNEYVYQLYKSFFFYKKEGFIYFDFADISDWFYGGK